MTPRVYIPSPDPVWTLDAVADTALAGVAWLTVFVVALAIWSAVP